MEEQGLGWRSGFGSGKAGDAITSGIEAPGHHSVEWDDSYSKPCSPTTGIW